MFEPVILSAQPRGSAVIVRSITGAGLQLPALWGAQSLSPPPAAAAASAGSAEPVQTAAEQTVGAVWQPAECLCTSLFLDYVTVSVSANVSCQPFLSTSLRIDSRIYSVILYSNHD